MDRGYLDFKRLNLFHLGSAFFVIRSKTNISLKRRYSHPVRSSTGVRSDQTVVLAAIGSARAYPNALRRIVFVDPETAKRLEFLTNNFDLPADSEGDTETSMIAVLNKGLTTIAMPIEQTDKGVRILPLNADLPRLFCDFPLLGTELFPFPVIINNPTFNPTDARDGLFLTQTQRADPPSDHNRAVIKQALALYLELLKYASENAWRNLHLFAVAKPIPTGLSWHQHRPDGGKHDGPYPVSRREEIRLVSVRFE